MFCSVITKNLNWEILSKNLVLKDVMGLRMKYSPIMGGGGHRKIRFLGGGGGGHEK